VDSLKLGFTARVEKVFWEAVPLRLGQEQRETGSMRDLNDLIEYENENTTLDFKETQYVRPYEQFIKDIMSMANADTDVDRHIVVGVDHHADGTRDFIGIKQNEFIDSATYHQIIRENVEPEIHFDYTPYDYKGSHLGVFRIYDCNNRPYMMRKDYLGLKKGAMLIRKGSHQTPVTREDLDRIWRRRSDEFTARISIGFDVVGMPNKIRVTALGKIELPSDRAAEEIRQLLKERSQSKPTGDNALIRSLIESGSFPRSVFSGRAPYSQRSTTDLEKNLHNVKNTYREDDLHELYEVHGTKLNLLILNEGESYVEDASIQVRILKTEGLRVANKIHWEPDRSGPLGMSIGHIGSIGPFAKHYPSLKNYKDYIEVSQKVGTLRHGIPAQAFEQPLRMIFGTELLGQTIILDCTLRGKQLRTPRQATLRIQVTGPKSS